MNFTSPSDSPYRSESLQCFMDGVSDFQWIVAHTTPRARAKFVYTQEAGSFCGYEGCFTRRHGLASYLIKVTTAGEGLLNYEGIDYRIPVGSFFWIDCQKPQYYVTAPDTPCWAVSCIHLNGGIAKIYYDSFMAHNNYCPVAALKAPEEADAIIQQIITLYREHHYEYAADIQSSCLITQLLTHCLSSVLLTHDATKSAQHIEPSFLQNVHSYIFNNYREKISLDALASTFLVNKFYLQKQFRQFYGYTPLEYQNLLRIAKAKELLRNCSISVNEVAYYLGFESSSYFIQLFKKNEGSTPRQYRLEWNRPL